MKLGIGLSQKMLTADNFRFARQAGATHIVAHLLNFSVRKSNASASGTSERVAAGCDPGESVWSAEGLCDLRRAINREGLELEALENFDPSHWSDVLLDGPRRRPQMQKLKTIIRSLGRAGIPIMGYNFSIAGTWGRTPVRTARGGAQSPGFHDPPQPPIPSGMVWNTVVDQTLYDPVHPKGVVGQFDHDELWRRLQAYLDELLPVAEEAGVKLALHPDDPPMPTLRGTPRLVYLPDHYQRLLDLSASPSNTMEFCIGTLAEMAEGNIYEVVDRYSRTGRIGYVHFLNVRGRVPHYDEVFVDEGDVDMLRVLRILKQNEFNGVLVPDHTPQMSCDDPWHVGQAFTLGWMKAALTAIDDE